MKLNHTHFLKTGLAICMTVFAGLTVEAQDKLHVIKLKKAKDLHAFFKYTGNDVPIISGHRGGMEMGFPENSIAAFENTLRHTPAIFEIDPRLTKDSVIVLMHDETLNRTTNATGKLSDYTYEEVQKMRLKDAAGHVTDHTIPTLAEVIEWARGKTIINLDRKDVPFQMIADIIKKHKGEAFVMLTVHAPEQAQFYLNQNKNSMFSAFVKTKAEFDSYVKAGIPFSQMIAYIGPKVKADNQELYRLLNGKGTMCMISSAPTYDKLKSVEARKEAFIAVIRDGSTILESDIPIEAAAAIQGLIKKDSPKWKFYGVRK
jgi:glycerophosphoryl diester phosphodiesterase